ncbi:O-antigen ligase family protein [Chishuiella sp.]|uniref:O-antigen ligase family protein n=1 Tax=Chishuiella sp. TaxID=1969467 RepID=UPI0028AFEFB2|nr:O-antigen ligase family protein [Chishuiella sp.]
MKINLNLLIEFSFYLGLFFFSFNQIEVMPFLGEYVREFGAIFLFLGFFLMLFEIFITKKIDFPFKDLLFRLILFFFFFTFITIIINYSTVQENFFKRISGFNRFIRQMLSLSIPIFIFLPFFWRVYKNWSIEKIFYSTRKCFFISLLFCTFYSFWEILYSFFGIYQASKVLDVLSLLPFLKRTYITGGRIAAFTYEAPALAIYLITVSGWMFSYILTEKRIIMKILPTFLVLTLTFFSGSRTGLFVIFILFLFFIAYLYAVNTYRYQIKLGFIGILILFFLIGFTKSDKIKYAFKEKIESLDFANNLKSSVSNKTRFGMQFASIEVFKQNPCFGVGFGQQAFHTRFYYPRWSKKDNYEFTEYYLNKKNPSFPPGFNLYLRISTEMGLFGLFIWIMILFYSIFLCIKFYKKSNNQLSKILIISISISLIGLYINWLQIDTFRMYGVWLYFVILMLLPYLELNEKK